MILGIKINKFHEGEENIYKFDSLELSNLMSQCSENEDLVG